MLINQIGEDTIAAMRNKDAATLATLRLFRTAFNSLAKEKRVSPSELLDTDIIQIARKQIKQCQEALDGFMKGNRSDKVKEEEANIAVLSRYLPKELSEEEIKAIVTEAMTAVSTLKGINPLTIKNMGDVMKMATTEAKGRVAGNVLSKYVQEALKGT